MGFSKKFPSLGRVLIVLALLGLGLAIFTPPPTIWLSFEAFGGASSTKPAILLTGDEEVNSRAFASAIPIEDGHLVCFSRREAESGEYEIWCQKFSSLLNEGPGPISEEFPVIRAANVGASLHAYVPYLYLTDSGASMLFTARGVPDAPDEEWVALAESKDLRSWEVVEPRVLTGRGGWESNSVENFGVILFQGSLWMNYESTGSSGRESERSIGIASSKDDGVTWERIGDKPSITGGVYCAGFFQYEGQVYLIASSHSEFRVYRADDPSSLSDLSFIGSFTPSPRGFVLGTPSLVSASAEKAASNYSPFILTYSHMTPRGIWETLLVRWDSPQEFLDGLR